MRSLDNVYAQAGAELLKSLRQTITETKIFKSRVLNFLDCQVKRRELADSKKKAAVRF